MKNRYRMLALAMAGAITVSGVPVYAQGQTVYVSGNGAKENSGQTADSPLGSIYAAQELLGESGTIVVTDTIYISGERTYELEDGIVLEAADDLEGPIFEIAPGGELTLNNIVIIGNDSTLIYNAGTLRMGDDVTLKVKEEEGDGAVYTAKTAATYLNGELVAGTAAKETEESEENSDQETETDAKAETEAETETESETSDKEEDIWRPYKESEETEESEKSEPVNLVFGTEKQEAQTEQIVSKKETEKETEKDTEKETEAKISAEQESETGAKETAATESTEKETTAKETTETETETTAQETEEIRQSAVEAVKEAIVSLEIHSKEDITSLLAVSQAYDGLTGAEQESIPEETRQLLESAKEMAAAYNHTQLGVTVYGDLPWYVQFQVSINEAENGEEQGLTILVPYELKLWNLYTDSAYELPEGQTVTVTMPVPETEDQGQLTIFHYQADGTVESIKPVIQGDLMSFETTTFSPFSVAGSTVITGIGIGSLPASGTGSSSSSTGSSTTGTSSSSGSSVIAGIGIESLSASGTGSTETETGSSTGSTGTTSSAANTGDDTNTIPAVTGFLGALAVIVGLFGYRKRKIV